MLVFAPAAWAQPASHGSHLIRSILPSQSVSIFSPAGTPAHSIFVLAMFVFAITGAIFLTVAGLLTYALIRYRQRPGDDKQEPVQIYGSNQLELAWTVIPTLIVVVLFLTTARFILAIEHAHKPADAVNVDVIGHKFWWEFRYPKYGIVTANELHVPVSDPKKPTPTYLSLTSSDVMHSFWVPRLAGKTDVIPDRVNTMWIDPDAAGVYLGQCAEYCGIQHAKMLIRVYAQSPADFMQWVKNQQAESVQDPTVGEGRIVFEQHSCINCHTIRGTIATGRVGPDLTHLASRDTIGSGIVPNTQANLKQWIKDPATFKPGCLMPAVSLTPDDLDAVVAYLETLH